MSEQVLTGEPPVRYRPDLETPHADEAETVDGIVASMRRETDHVAAAQGSRAVRASHAKTSGIVKGTFVVHEGLPPALRQGLFAQPGRYPALVRLAQGPGEHLSDKISTHRGLALKLFDVPGTMLDGHTERTQDFVLATGPVFPNPDAAAFLRAMRGIEKNSGGNDGIKQAVSAAARGLNATAKAVTGSDVPILDFFGHALSHPLAESYHSQAAIRYGDYLAKVALFPVAAAQTALAGQTLDPSADPDVFRNATAGFFEAHDAVFEFRVQLCTNLDTMPVEDASKEWPETESPYVTVATLELPRQQALSQARLDFVEERMSFRPAHSLEAHRPLGSLMRARLQVYSALVAYRQAHNRVQDAEPVGPDAVPD